MKITLITCCVLLSSLAHTAVDVRNNSGQNIWVSFYGDGCRHFDEDHFDYKPCAEKAIAANQTSHFSDFTRSGAKKKDWSIIPRIIFSSLGFSYACKVRKFWLRHLCPAAVTFSNPKDESSTAPLQENTLLTSHGARLSSAENYFVDILPEYGYFPQPYVDCSITQINEREE